MNSLGTFYYFHGHGNKLHSSALLTYEVMRLNFDQKRHGYKWCSQATCLRPVMRSSVLGFLLAEYNVSRGEPWNLVMVNPPNVLGLWDEVEMIHLLWHNPDILGLFCYHSIAYSNLTFLGIQVERFDKNVIFLLKEPIFYIADGHQYLYGISQSSHEKFTFRHSQIQNSGSIGRNG